MSPITHTSTRAQKPTILPHIDRLTNIHNHMLLILPLIHKHLFIQRSLQHLQYVAIPSCRIDDISIFPSAPFAQTQASKTEKDEKDGVGENGDLHCKICIYYIGNLIHRRFCLSEAYEGDRNHLQQPPPRKPICHLPHRLPNILSLPPLAIREHRKINRSHSSLLLALLRQFHAISLKLEVEAIRDVGFAGSSLFLEMIDEIGCVFATPSVVGDGVEELGAVGGHAFYDVGEGAENFFYGGPAGSHGGAVVDYEGLVLSALCLTRGEWLT
jgi:hypothetical protein